MEKHHAGGKTRTACSFSELTERWAARSAEAGGMKGSREFTANSASVKKKIKRMAILSGWESRVTCWPISDRIIQTGGGRGSTVDSPNAVKTPQIVFLKMETRVSC